MKKRLLRVMVASEYPELRRLLRGVAESESGVEVVSEADNASVALESAARVKPDVVIVDCHLPHSAGLDAVPLSRVSGLDTAQAISQEVPGAKVMLLNNLDSSILSDDAPTLGPTGAYCVGKAGKCISIAEWAQSRAVDDSHELLFANVTRQEQAAYREQSNNLFDHFVLFGAFGFAAGFALTLTMILAPIGLPLAALGAATAAVGLTGKLVGSAWRRMGSRPETA